MSNEVWQLIIDKIPIAFQQTLYMTLWSTIFGYLIGLPWGVALAITNRGGIAQNKGFYTILSFITNVMRSIPFILLIVILMNFTKALVGRSYGPTATIVPLVVASVPFIGRMVESSLLEVDSGIIEAANSMGASRWTIIWRVLLVEARTSLIVGATIVISTILSYTAMAGAIGGGGLGDVAIQSGYYRNEREVMWVAVILIVLLVLLFQGVGMLLAKVMDKRK